jgi:hypothetical protein
MALHNLEAVQQLQGSEGRSEGRSSATGPITLEVKQTGKRSAGNPRDWKRGIVEMMRQLADERARDDQRNPLLHHSDRLCGGEGRGKGQGHEADSWNPFAEADVISVTIV